MQPQDVPVWYVAYTKPRMEGTALFNLERQGFQAYLPLFKTFRRSPGEALRTVFEPLFPRYIFLRPASQRQSLSTVRSTIGICSLVDFGDGPAPVQPETLRLIREFERDRSEADPMSISPIRPGARVRMRRGGLQGLAGAVLSVAKHRVTFLLQILGREKRVTVGHEELELAG